MVTVDDLSAAVERGELRLRFQPVVEASSGRVTAALAAPRWEHPRHGPLQPNIWPDAAGSADVARELLRWFADGVGRILQAWAGHRSTRSHSVLLQLPCNLLAVDDVGAVLHAGIGARGPMGRVVLLASEPRLRGASEHTQTGNNLLSFLRVGGRVGACDIGLPSTSVSFVDWLPVDVLAVHRAVVAELSTSPTAMGLVDAVRALATAAHAAEMVPGVDDELLLRAARSLGCGAVTGAAICPPIDPDELLTTFLRDWEVERTVFPPWWEPPTTEPGDGRPLIDLSDRA